VYMEAHMRRLQLHLFGNFRLNTSNGHEIHIPLRKARALLAYLALVS